MTNDNSQPHDSRTIDEMVDGLDLDADGAAHLRSALHELKASAREVPVASPEVVALLQGATPLGRTTPPRIAVVITASALALGGASAAAATNNLPRPLQSVVAKVTGVPRPDPAVAEPVEPTHPPAGAPGRTKDHDDNSDHDKSEKHDNSEAPGQRQKATKPDPRADGPARPADPGSHGRDHTDDDQSGHDKSGHPKNPKSGRPDWAHPPFGQPGPWNSGHQGGIGGDNSGGQKSHNRGDQGKSWSEKNRGQQKSGSHKGSHKSGKSNNRNKSKKGSGHGGGNGHRNRH